MTRDELYRKRMMFQIYSSRNQMPKFETNANNEPLKHSATNDYLEYRKKVAAGVRMQKENNKSNLFNVTEANEQYYQDLMDQNIIIHAGTYKPAGTHEYVAVLPDFWGKGKHRYFYTQQEWDNYQKNAAGAGRAGADRGAREGADAKNKALATAGQNAYADARKNSVNAVIDNAKKDLKNKALADAGQKAFENSQKNRNVTIAQSGREAAIRNSQGGSKEDASDITNTVKNYSASKKEYEKNADYAKNAGADRAANEAANNKTPYRGADWEKNAAAAGKAEAARGNKESAIGRNANRENAKNRGEEEYAEEFANGPQSGSSNAARAEGEGYDRYKKDMAEREAFREESEREALNYQERESNKKESVASGKNEAQRALKDTASGIANSKNPAKEITSNKTYSKYIDDIVGLIDSGAAEIGSDGTIHIDKTKNPKAVYKITNDDVIALNTELLKNGMTQRSINAAVMDEIEKRAKASKEKKAQKGISSFINKSKASQGVESFKNTKKANNKVMAANQSGSGNAAAAEGERRDIEREREAAEEEERKANTYDRNKGKKVYATARHDGLEDGITTEDISPEQEYLNFRARVEEGMKHYSTARGLMSIPINQALAHAGTGKYGDYYNKIDNYYGPGKARYFKTKDEWDAHQRELEGYKKKADKEVAERDRKIAMQNEWNKNSQANPGAQRGAQEYINGRIANKQNQKETANKNYYETQSKANPEQRRGFSESAQGRLAGNNFTPSTTSNGFKSTPNANLYGVDNNTAAKTAVARDAYQSSYRNDLLNKAQSGREAAINNSASGIDKDIQRRKFLEANQSGREAAMNNSSNNSASVQRLLNNLSAPVPENVQMAWDARTKAANDAAQDEVYRQAYERLNNYTRATNLVQNITYEIEEALFNMENDPTVNKNAIKEAAKNIRSLCYDFDYAYDPEYNELVDKLRDNYDRSRVAGKEMKDRLQKENSNLTYKINQIEKQYNDANLKEISNEFAHIFYGMDPEARMIIYNKIATIPGLKDMVASKLERSNSSHMISEILEDVYGTKLIF